MSIEKVLKAATLFTTGYVIGNLLGGFGTARILYKFPETRTSKEQRYADNLWAIYGPKVD